MSTLNCEANARRKIYSLNCEATPQPGYGYEFEATFNMRVRRCRQAAHIWFSDLHVLFIFASWLFPVFQSGLGAGLTSLVSVSSLCIERGVGHIDLSLGVEFLQGRSLGTRL